MLLLAALASYFLSITPPLFKKPKRILDTFTEKQIPQPIKLDLFMENDIFGTIAPVSKTSATKQNLVPVMPVLSVPHIPVPPEPTPADFIPPLPITINGIVIGSNEFGNIALIVDETGKEGIYHLGDKVKDGTIARITKNRIVIFRSNGQEEIFYLRKEDSTPPGATQENRWTYVVKKLESEGNYQLDPQEFKKQIETLGELLDMLNAIPVFKKGIPIGIKINKTESTEIAPVMGFEKGDIVEAINNISTCSLEDRLKLYESVINVKDGDTITINLKRNGESKILSYKIGRISRISKYAFLEGKTPNSTSTPVPAGLPDNFKKTPLQEYNAQQKDFDVRHQEHYNDTITQIRNRLLNNMNMHAPNMRVR